MERNCFHLQIFVKKAKTVVLSMGNVVPLRDIWQWVEAKNAAKCPTILKEVPLNNEYPIQKVNSAKVDRL